MYRLVLIILILIFHFLAPSYADSQHTIYVSQTSSPSAPVIQKMFEDALPKGSAILYTKVPRGLIVSVDESIFFSDENDLLKIKGTAILDGIAKVLEKLDNECTVEGHTESHNFERSLYKSDWELSTARANTIVEYLVMSGGVASSRLFALGYGELMPFKGNVSTKDGFNNRIDFVIFDYETNR